MIEWDNSSSFHAFFPNSHNFQAFVMALKPFMAAPATPELYEAEERSISCTSSNITQIIKVKSTKETAHTWKQLEGYITKSATHETSFYHADGIEKDEGTFLGLIGWKNLEVSLSSSQSIETKAELITAIPESPGREERYTIFTRIKTRRGNSKHCSTNNSSQQCLQADDAASSVLLEW